MIIDLRETGLRDPLIMGTVELTVYRETTVYVTPEEGALSVASAGVTQAIDGIDTPDGVTVGLAVAGAEQDESFAQMGFAMLIAIVLVDLVNKLRDQGLDLDEAVVHGTRLRLRLILMTDGTPTEPTGTVVDSGQTGM